MATPESKVKAMVRKVLAEFSERVEVDGFSVETLKQYWPVPSGFGESDLDCIVCYYGVYIAIETKASGKKPTPRQELCIARTHGAGGMTFAIDGEAGCHLLRQALKVIRTKNNANNS